MLTMKKIEAGIETVGYLLVVMVLVCVVLPVAALISFVGVLLSFVKINFVSDFAKRILDALICFVKFVTKRVRARTRELEALRAQCSAAN